MSRVDQLWNLILGANNAVKSKEKSEKKEGPRQQTLFGFGERKDPAKKKATSIPPSVDELESQASDVTMADASQIETQPDGWEETQLVEDGL